MAHARSLFRWAVNVSLLCRSNPFDKIKMPELTIVAREKHCTRKQRDKLLIKESAPGMI